MKRILYPLVIVLVVALNLGCKKKTENKYYVKFKMDGVWKTHTNVVSELGPDLANPSNIDMVINGNSDNADEIFTIMIQKHGSDITTGTYYSDNIAGDYWSEVSLMTSYNNDLRRFSSDNSVSGMPAAKYTINITGITSTEIRGNFTGNYISESNPVNPADAVRQITEGEFIARRID